VSAPLIIDARHRLRWQQRLLSDASTAVLWSVWLWLWLPLVHALASARLTPALGAMSGLGAAAGGLDRPVFALVGASGSLLVWKGLRPVRRAPSSPELTVREQARHYRLPEHALREAREASICVVHHDAQGRIVRLEPHAMADHGLPARRLA
jgi:poly-beta-1,6-N-acetyl-D-glucosamine biosynthesis protein PgaD